MRYSRVHVTGLGYALAPVVVSSEELEERLSEFYAQLRIAPGQLEALTGIAERRWWPAGHRLSDGAIAAARKTLAGSGVRPQDIGAVVYAGVCREGFEPATACRVAGEIGTAPNAAVYDLSNACLGVLNGMIDVANRIELGQVRAGLVVSCESAREIVEESIARMLDTRRMSMFSDCLATLTGGSGAAAVLLTDGSFGGEGPRLLGGVMETAPEHHALCRWGMESADANLYRQYMTTDAVSVLKHGVTLGARTWAGFLAEMGWRSEDVDKVICHQVGQANRDAMLKLINVSPDKDYITYPFLGNMGTVSLPLSAALAAERGFLTTGDRVAWLGIGSGLNCMMLGMEW
jgi:3-oxoacyl-[acyl-carrier-protein] synthase-3